MNSFVPASALRRGLRVATAAVVALALSGASVQAASPAGTTGDVHLDQILSGYDRPVGVVTTGATNRRIFIVEQSGRIKIANKTNGTWTKVGTFLDLSKVVDYDGMERGLLGLAFDPDYATNGLFYVDYTAKAKGSDYGPDVLYEYKRKDINHANPNSARLVLSVKDPYENHNAGNLEFGPDDYLYVTEGDGGSGDDPQNRAQNLNSRLGKMLRIDPRDPDGNGPKRYRVPADNPFVGVGGAKPEIWAYGLRNTWRWSFDRLNGDLWLGDVGQCKYEEIDHSPSSGGVDAGKGVNYGWNGVEGLHQFVQGNACSSQPLCTTNCHTLPVFESSHASGDAAIIGGYVYRGSDYPAWDGYYVFADEGSGRVRVLKASDASLTLSKDTGHSWSSFGEDAAGRLYAVDVYGGTVHEVSFSGLP